MHTYIEQVKLTEDQLTVLKMIAPPENEGTNIVQVYLNHILETGVKELGKNRIAEAFEKATPEKQAQAFAILNEPVSEEEPIEEPLP